MDPQLIRILERVIAISQTGLTYTDGVFDRERYESLRELVGEILERVDANPPPLQVAFPKEEGYRTPKLDVRGLVLRDGKVLLVRERADGCWALPGGWADVGISASANIEKEISEESGLVTRAVRLLALLDRDKHAHDASPWHTYKAAAHARNRRCGVLRLGCLAAALGAAHHRRSDPSHLRAFARPDRPNLVRLR
jgi:ADP-ribose pyrophosphatase YjhB (NUDIX family)